MFLGWFFILIDFRQMGVLGDTFQWTDSDQVIVYLKQSLWALKALQFFHDNLRDALGKIGDARDEMLTQIKIVSSRWMVSRQSF
jgi:hypothetical protein